MRGWSNGGGVGLEGLLVSFYHLPLGLWNEKSREAVGPRRVKH